MDIKDQKEFPVDSAQLKEVRNFARGLFDQVPEFEDNREELVLALAEAAQNIVKHAYSGQPSGDTMRVEIEYQDKVLKMELFDKGKPVIPENIKPRKLTDIKAGGLGTFFIGQIMDEVVFKTNKEDWVNHLILTKRF
ncbi:anti-sigma regulatory factor (Ser/Thr protein kinase) [Candidatus Pelagibacter sp. HTCC7211]|jgi:anti-sigma regulatory factor (Ser/Thr protein kinase)|uniref:ATP-binding protein n=1 Tax=Pelagibacter sp. (strain HTCC7211) TaxID=439493 RepID=UPI0001839057|nr:ATP-binding protein [Candidatus Pelagibacter sp. HTCC7211]EDZ59701.1 anti-sigma regulatory factor (Ser/Thr protein kinase) [Candidatus Pelagibacter sp. HTCC7211]MBD1151307.1 ATP-binding protein [Pelagibacterales bacterium SAG-MED25]